MSNYGVLNFDPMKSFGEDVAETYDENLRGDEAETVACLEQLANGGPYWSWRLARGASACRWLQAGLGWTGWNSRRPWSPGCVQSPVETGLR